MLMMLYMLHSYERMQESADKKFGNVAAYRLYKKTTRSINTFGFYRFTLIQSGGPNMFCSFFDDEFSVSALYFHCLQSCMGIYLCG